MKLVKHGEDKEANAMIYYIQNMPLSLVNGFHRFIQSEIPIWGIEKASISFEENTSVLNDDILCPRLYLGIIDNFEIENNISEDKRGNINFKLRVANSEPEIKTVYYSDFEFYTGDTPIKNLFVYPATPFAKLKIDQKITCSGKLIKTTSDEKGAGFNPVCGPSLLYVDPLKTDFTKDFDIEFKYEKQANGDPKNYYLHFELTGTHPSFDEFIKQGIIEYVKKMEYIKYAIENSQDEKLIIRRADVNFKAFDFVFNREDHTLGNLLVQYALETKEAEIASYEIPHPLRKEMVFRIDGENLEDTKKRIVKVIDKIISDIKA